MKLYWLYRYFYTEKWNRYSPTFYLAKQFKDLAEAKIIWIKDNVIPENRYTWEVVPWIITMRRFLDCTYDDSKITDADFNWILWNVSWMNDIVMFETAAKAIEWIKANTDLVEKEDWVFVIHEEYEDEMWETIPEKLLIID